MGDYWNNSGWYEQQRELDAQRRLEREQAYDKYHQDILERHQREEMERQRNTGVTSNFRGYGGGTGRRRTSGNRLVSFIIVTIFIITIVWLFLHPAIPLAIGNFILHSLGLTG
jgi:hypothetical protein